jgi:hypothetical protein
MRERRLSDVYLVEWEVYLHKVKIEMIYDYLSETYKKKNCRAYYEEERGKKYFTLDPLEKLIDTLHERIRKEYEDREDVEEVLRITITSIKPL